MPIQNRILVVDDEEITRKNLKEILEKAGYEVDTAKDGDNALERTDKTLYDVALVDIVIPGKMNGLELLEKIKEESPATIGIIFTGYGTSEAPLEARRRCAYTYLTKPLNFDYLKSVINEALRKEKDFAEEFEITTEDLIYEKHREELEKEHKDEFVAISFDDKLIVGKDSIKVVDEAIEKFGSGNFVFKRIGYNYLARAKKGMI